jgi:hypothetical protein
MDKHLAHQELMVVPTAGESVSSVNLDLDLPIYFYILFWLPLITFIKALSTLLPSNAEVYKYSNLFYRAYYTTY